jgi:hypothetical protein
VLFRRVLVPVVAADQAQVAATATNDNASDRLAFLYRINVIVL